jgi:hypothetical protein
MDAQVWRHGAPRPAAASGLAADPLDVEASVEQLRAGQAAGFEEGRHRLVEVGQIPAVEDDALASIRR